MSKRVLIVIDMLNDFVHPEGMLFCGDSARKIIPYISGLIEDFRSKGFPIIYLMDNHSPDDEEFKLFPAHAVSGSWGAEVVDELSPKQGDFLVPKTRFSGFFRTDLEQILEGISPDEVWVVGVCTSICVMDTVSGLRNRNYDVVVPLNGVADFDQEMHDCAIKRMERVYRVRLIV